LDKVKCKLIEIYSEVTRVADTPCVTAYLASSVDKVLPLLTSRGPTQGFPLLGDKFFSVMAQTLSSQIQYKSEK
jgi:hypothetical protein